MDDRISKLIAHERSARRLGNVDEANAYEEKIRELERKKAVRGEEEGGGAGRWKCSCGYELVLSMEASAGAQVIADLMLAPHRRPGHRLEFIG